MIFQRIIKSDLISFLSIYIFIYYFIIRILYTYYGIELGINIWFYRIFFYLPIVLWLILILIEYYLSFKSLKKNNFLNLFIFLYVYIFVYIIYNHFFGLEYISMSVSIYQTKALYYAILNILLAVYLYKELSLNNFKKSIFIVWCIYVVMLIININNFVLDTHGLSSLHLLLGDSFVLISILAIFINIKNKSFENNSFFSGIIFSIYYKIKGNIL